MVILYFSYAFYNRFGDTVLLVRAKYEADPLLWDMRHRPQQVIILLGSYRPCIRNPERRRHCGQRLWQYCRKYLAKSWSCDHYFIYHYNHLTIFTDGFAMYYTTACRISTWLNKSIRWYHGFYISRGLLKCCLVQYCNTRSFQGNLMCKYPIPFHLFISH